MIAEKLVKEALWDGEHATWFGDECVPSPSGEGTVVYRAVDGDLYGGTAGIGLYLARYAAISGDTEAARTARGALAHAANWVRRTRPDGALLSGTAGVATATLEAAELLADDRLMETATRLTRLTCQRIPQAVDLICGRAGTLLALLHLPRSGPETELAATTADTLAQSLIDDARPGPVRGTCWPSDIDTPPLCGLAHGASGVALALTEWGKPDGLRLAAEAADFERAWFSADQGNWPDLREKHSWPVYWCHGALGIGQARLRQYDVTGHQIYAAEAGVAVDAALRLIAAMANGKPDLSLCHGLSGAIELLLDAATIFGQPALREAARDAAAIAIDLVGDGSWPCGIPGGDENPSLFLGLAGIGTALLRAQHPQIPSTALAYAGRTMTTRVIVQLSRSPDPEDLRLRVDRLRAAVPGCQVERVSPHGRALLRIPADVDVDSALTTLNQIDDVEYAERDVIDTAQD
ncbi:lanthionine synthetase LanC family protein [Acrocarpospora sp. B8E8]|uniref:lanthionine synthetase LanC family protein n=1 Tax=Acrocarpospora sp. B8E8 TaxID=3153572 RepID=UPI00325EB6B4